MGHVCLINPPGIKTVSGLQMHTPNPPLGLAYVAAAVRQAGHRVTVIDATGEAMDQITPLPQRPDILVQGLSAAQIVGRIGPDVDAVGLGCTFSTLWPISREILRAVRAARPGIPIIVGGEHPTALPEHVLASSPADVCVVGEGEETIFELLAALLGGGDLSQVAGIVFRDGDRLVRTAVRRRLPAIDDLPWPAWDLFPIEAYIERRQMSGINRGRAMPVLGTRGCPYRCTFCSSPQMWTTAYVRRDVGRLCDEIEYYQARYGVTDVHFQDLSAIVSKPWILALCRQLQRRRLKITWQLPSGTRCEVLDDEVCRMLAATGCRNLSLAPESGSKQILAEVGKRIDLDKMLGAVRAALRHRLSLSCFFVIGFPHETRQTLRDSLRLCRRLARLGVDDVGVAKFIPYPGSQLFRQLLKAARLELNDDFFLSSMDNYSNKGRQRVYSEFLTSRQLNRWMIRLYRNFYLLSFLYRPLRTLGVILRALLGGGEETRYAKWFRDKFRTRRQWRQRAASNGRAPAPCEPTGEDGAPAAAESLNAAHNHPHGESGEPLRAVPNQGRETVTV